MGFGQKYAILQSGYLSYGDLELNPASVVPDSEVVHALVLGKPVRERSNPYFYSKLVNDLFAEYSNDNSKLKDFEFRERILQAAKFVFDGDIIDNWIKFQYMSEFYTKKHALFLSDTLAFILTGKRETSINTWLYLVNAQLPDSKQRGECVFQDYAKAYTGMWMYGSGDVKNLSAQLVRWVKQSNGFEDLLLFLKIVFGCPENR